MGSKQKFKIKKNFFDTDSVATLAPGKYFIVLALATFRPSCTLSDPRPADMPTAQTFITIFISHCSLARTRIFCRSSSLLKCIFL